MKLFERLENLFAAVGMAEGGDAETASMMAGAGSGYVRRDGLTDGKGCLSNPARA